MKRYIAKCISFYLLKSVKIYVDFFKKVCIINTGIKEKVDILKMDKSFFDDILESKRGKIIIESIINMSHKLNIKVVAEGIETKEQVEYLKSAGCDMIQGYIYEKPISVASFEEKYLK